MDYTSKEFWESIPIYPGYLRANINYINNIAFDCLLSLDLDKKRFIIFSNEESLDGGNPYSKLENYKYNWRVERKISNSLPSPMIYINNTEAEQVEIIKVDFDEIRRNI